MYETKAIYKAMHLKAMYLKYETVGRHCTYKFYRTVSIKDVKFAI